MGTCDRAFFRDTKNFSKKLKRPLKEVALIMPLGFSDESFYATFKECYSGLWQGITEYKKQCDRMNAERIRRHLQSKYYFLKAEAYLAKRARAIIANIRVKHRNGELLPEEERIQIREKLINRAKCKKETKQDQVNQTNNYLQNVRPFHTNYFIKLYFACKGQTQEKVDIRYRILQEAAKFKCKATIELMFKANAIEPNYHLRFFVFQILQKKFGFPQVKLKRNHHRKGRDLNIVPMQIDTPEKLIQALYETQFALEANKRFDVFLSHSSLDKNNIFKMKTLLNSKGLSVYVDWIEDKESLKRELTNADTARVLIERIKKSKTIIYIKTRNSSQSLWTPWELGYAQAIGKKICVLEMEHTPNTPQYLDIYDKADLRGEDIIVENHNETQSIENWIKN